MSDHSETMQPAQSLQATALQALKCSRYRFFDKGTVPRTTSYPPTWSPQTCQPVQRFDGIQNSISIHSFPDGIPTHLVQTHGRLHDFDYRRKDGLLCYAATDGKANYPQNRVSVHGVQILDSGCTGRVFEMNQLRDTGSVTLSDEDRFVVGHHGCTEVFRMGHSSKEIRLGYTSWEEGQYAWFMTEDLLVVSTCAGLVYKWDLRAPQRPVWCVRPSKNSSLISHVQTAGDGVMLYVSCVTDGMDGLAAWDMRMGDFPRSLDLKPVLTFNGHITYRTEVYEFGRERLRFDIEETETGGLLVAGGFDRIVRVWDSKKGGRPIERVSMDRYGDFDVEEGLQGTEFVGWGGTSSRRNRGLWIMGELGFLSCEIVSREGPYVE